MEIEAVVRKYMKKIEKLEIIMDSYDLDKVQRVLEDVYMRGMEDGYGYQKGYDDGYTDGKKEYAERWLDV